MALNRQQIANIYRPQGPKAIALGQAWSSGGQLLIPGAQIDLSVPIEGIRLVFKLRDVIAVATMTTPAPMGHANLISRIVISGKNSRAGGNVTLWDADLSSIILSQLSVNPRPISINGYSSTGAASSGVEVSFPQISAPLTFFGGTAGTYDIRIAVDIPFFPFECAPFARSGYLVRNQEFADSLQIRLVYGTVTNGADNALGTDAATTTHTFSSYGSGTGSPTIDLYSLPVIMGVDLDAQMVPGFLSRITLPVSTILQSAGGINTRLLVMEKQNTKRIWAIIGVSTTTPTLKSVSDTNLTTLGMFIGGNRTVRENDDIFAHKIDQMRRYGTQPIQGLTMLDFIPSGNPDSHYDAGAAGEGSTLELRGTVAGVANAYGIFIQETERYKPMGPLYSA